MNSSIPPKGSLEELFRHHLLESEAAAVPPRPQVWEQVDNRLLLAQNEKYRRRLVAYRWAMAASLLLASLAGGGWWRSQQGAAPTGTLAQATTQPGAQPTLAAERSALPGAAGSGLAPARLSPAAAVASAARFSSSTNSLAIDQTATLAASASTSSTSALATQPSASRRPKLTSTRVYAAARPAGSGVGFGLLPIATVSKSKSGQRERSARFASAATTEVHAANAATQLADQEPSESSSATAALPTLALVAAHSAAGEIALAAHPASLAALNQADLPPSLAEVAVAPGPALELARGWQYGLAYSASAYQPNIDWTKPAAAYNSALGFNSASVTRSAAAEYRDNLRPGLGQRLSLWATRRLGNGRWSLRTGLEVAQNTAISASSVAFVGEQVADLSYTQAGIAYSPVSAGSARHLQRTSYRYRSVSVPAELRYSNPLKTGFSFYGRVGAFVSALLNVRSEVEGTPEAGRTYTLQSASTPYRPYSGGLRGGAGLQYRPAGHQWSLNFGPVAELGILSLNADPGQDFWSQQRPYSFGLEAGMELGRGFKIQ